MASSPNESRASSASPKTPAKKYHMKSNFELGDEQPMHPIDSPTRRPYKPSGKKISLVHLTWNKHNGFEIFGN